MKKLIFVIALIAVILGGCSEEIDKSESLQTKHELRKFNVKTTTTERSSAAYFFVVGSYSSEKSAKGVDVIDYRSEEYRIPIEKLRELELKSISKYIKKHQKNIAKSKTLKTVSFKEFNARFDSTNNIDNPRDLLTL